MKKIKNALLIFIFFLIQSSNCLATTPETYNVSSAGGSSKFLFLLIGLILVGLVLFVGYKMDNIEETQKRKRKYNKIKNKEDVEDAYRDMFSSKEVIKDDTFTYDEIKEKKLNENSFEDSIIPKENITSEPNIEVEENIDDELMEQLLTESVIEEEERKIEHPELDNISKIFNENAVMNENVKNNYNLGVKGYDFNEEDLDLDDLESTIKEANIKKYTRKKKKEVNNSNVKKYTRKRKPVKEKTKPKRYTRKVVSDTIFEEVEDDEKIDIIDEIDNLDTTNDFNFKFLDISDFSDENNTNINEEKEIVEEKPKVKRGRKPKEKTDNKNVNIESLPKSGRGRKPKSSSTKTKASKKKTITKKAEKKEEPKKRGRKPKVLTEEEELRNAIEMLPKSRRGRKPKAK